MVGEAEPHRPVLRADRPAPVDRQSPSPYFRGVAAVPQRPVVVDGDTGELPPAAVAVPVARRYASARGMMPRQRWRSLRRGGGWTMAGLWIALTCWGVWVVSLRGGDMVGPAFAFGLVVGTGILVFLVSRLLGRMVLEGMLGRVRRSAWPSHLGVFLLLVAGGVAFLQQTWWVMAAWDWVSDALF